MMAELLVQRLTWASVLGPQYESFKRPVSPEAIVRLTHRSRNVHLVDLVHSADYVASFTWKVGEFAKRRPSRSLLGRSILDSRG